MNNLRSMDTADSALLGVAEDTILYWPNGTINLECLVTLLQEAADCELKGTDRLSYFHHRRVPNFSEEAPNWYNVPKEASVRHLRALHKQYRGVAFDPADYPRYEPIMVALITFPDGTNGVYDIGS